MQTKKRKVSPTKQVAEKAIKVADDVHTLVKVQAAARGRSMGEHVGDLAREKEKGA